MTKTIRRIAMAAGLASPALAQIAADLSIAESPAFTVLGLTPGVARPATPRELAAALLNGIDSRGNPQTGLSLDIAPYWLAAGHLVDSRIYKANPIVRLLAGAQLSLATAKAARPEAPSRLAAGMLVSIFDKGDPRLDDALADCLLKAAERALAIRLPCPPGENCPTEENTRRESLLKNTCREQSRRRNWNRSALAIGAARDTQSPAYALWSSLAYGFEGVPGLDTTSQLILQWSRRNNRPAGGLRLRAGTTDSHLSLEWVGSDGVSQLSLGVERRIADNLWLEIMAGGSSSRRIFLLTSFHWGAKQ